jgi:sugar phosphate isomerase/epimerase
VIPAALEASPGNGDRIRRRTVCLGRRDGGCAQRSCHVTGFSLDCLTLPDVRPIDFVRAAGEAGYESFSLWVQSPAIYEVMLATPAMAKDLARAISDHTVVLGNLEVFNINTDDPIGAFEGALAFGADLGARTATAIDFGAPRPDIADRLAAFHALCVRYGIGVLVEPISMGNVRTPQDGLDLIEASEVDARLVIDCVHLIRTGCTAETVRAIPDARIGYVQMCDGPASIAPEQVGVEATANRLYPGEGAFPLGDILAAIPPHVAVGLEVPNLARQRRGIPAIDRAREAINAARSVLEQVERPAR